MPDTKAIAPIREAVGIFFDAATLRGAVDDLLASGFERAELGLLAGEFTVKQKLGDFYTELTEHEGDANAPVTKFIAKEAGAATVHSMFGGLFFAGVAAAGGAVVASAAVLGGALAPAIAGMAAVGSVVAAFSKIIHESDAQFLEEEVEKGHLLLLVRTRDAVHEKVAVDVLGKHSAYDVHVCTIPAANT